MMHPNSLLELTNDRTETHIAAPTARELIGSMGYKHVAPPERRTCLTLMSGVLRATLPTRKKHHRKRTYAEEYEMFVKKYGLEWQSEGNH